MSRSKLFCGCQLGIWCREPDNLPRYLLEEHHVIPKAWANRQREAESSIKGGRDLKLLLCRNCHKWLQREMDTKLGKNPSKEEVYKFADGILSKLRY